MQSNTTNGDALAADPLAESAVRAGLPRPDATALAHSHRVADHIANTIRKAGGWIPFPDFMRSALHAPGLGYYAAGSRKFGAEGDFHTAPEMSSLFGQALGSQFAEVVAATGGSILELGAGSGRLAADVLERLDAIAALPESYAILETSAELRARQQQRVAQLARHLSSRVHWLDALPSQWTGVIFGNEVLDALAVEILARRNERYWQRGIVSGEGRFEWRDREIVAGPYRDAIERLFPGGDYESEINFEGEGLTATLAGILASGALMWIDYGFPAREYYHPQRNAGTLMCHYRQHAHADPLLLPGLQDITAHVDFSAIAHAALDAELEPGGYTSQANFLINCGIVELLEKVAEPGSAAFLRESNALQRLLGPSEMGELFKVIAFTRGLREPLRGFARGDRSGALEIKRVRLN